MLYTVTIFAPSGETQWEQCVKAEPAERGGVIGLEMSFEDGTKTFLFAGNYPFSIQEESVK